MADLTRRNAMAAGLLLPGAALAGAPAIAAPTRKKSQWRRGYDNQRIADLGDGRFLNPLMAGDHPDPTILKDGSDYYMTFPTDGPQSPCSVFPCLQRSICPKLHKGNRLNLW